jgi:GTP 3',8-cyclase
MNHYLKNSTPATEDALKRRVSYLRVSLTDRCNLRCSYCMPTHRLGFWKREEFLTTQELFRLIHIFTGLGVRKVRLTGGEPLLRPDLEEIIGRLRLYPEIRDISISTNGVYLAQRAFSLKAAGLMRINISLDTFQPERFKTISRNGQLRDVLRGIEAAISMGFFPVKINIVLMRGINDEELPNFVAYAMSQPVEIRFIELMPTQNNFAGNAAVGLEHFISCEETRRRIETMVHLGAEMPRTGVARTFPLVNGPGKIGFISPVSDHFCASCDRLRLTVRGELKTCLHGSDLVDLKTPLRLGSSDDEIGEIIRHAVLGKPPEHFIRADHFVSRSLQMSQIGG